MIRLIRWNAHRVAAVGLWARCRLGMQRVVAYLTAAPPRLVVECAYIARDDMISFVLLRQGRLVRQLCLLHLSLPLRSTNLCVGVVPAELVPALASHVVAAGMSEDHDTARWAGTRVLPGKGEEFAIVLRGQTSAMVARELLLVRSHRRRRRDGSHLVERHELRTARAWTPNEQASRFDR